MKAKNVFCRNEMRQIIKTQSVKCNYTRFVTIILFGALTHFIHIQTVIAHIDQGVTNTTALFEQINQIDTNVETNRTGKFLFDTFFGIDQPLADSLTSDDDDDDGKACNCGLLLIIFAFRFHFTRSSSTLNRFNSFQWFFLFHLILFLSFCCAQNRRWCR